MLNALYIPLAFSLLGFIVLAFVGFRLFRRALRFRRGTVPHCRNCEYILIGIVAERCPECGTLKDIVYGDLQRSPLLIAASLVAWILAAMFLFVSVISAIGVASTINWYQFHSTAWVLQDLRTGSGRPPPKNNPLNEQLSWTHGFPWERIDLASVALDELLRRERAGHLPEWDRNAIVELGLGAQQSWPNLSPVQYHLLDYLNDRILAGDLTAEQLDRFYRPALAEKLSVRPVVLFGDDVPIRVGMSRAWACRGNWLVEFTYGSARMDQQVVALSPPPPPSLRAAEFIYQDRPDDRTVPCPAIGHHVLNLTLLLKVRYGHNTFPEHAPVMRTVTLNLSTPFEVAAPSAENAIKLIDDPSLVPKLRAAATTSDFQYSNSNSEDISGVLRMATLPINIAFEVFGRYGKHQYPIGRFTQDAGSVGHYIWCKSQKNALPKPPPTIDIVLRSSPKAARTTLDLYQIWNGEIVLREVPVKDASR